MISVSEAKKLIQEYTDHSPPQELSIEQCGGLTLARDLFAQNDFPLFRQSSMDGYAFRFNDLSANQTLTINGVIQAGAEKLRTLGNGEAVRIFTGAPVPPGADTVVMQEKTEVQDGKLIIKDDSLYKGLNTREPGSDIAKNALACAAGTSLSPAAIGFLAGIGYESLPVIPRPRISIIVTGKELQQPGQPLQFGQVYESNSFALRTALAQLQIADIKIHWADDNLDMLVIILSTALKDADMVLLAGGISVGDYDFVLQATKELDIQQIFLKVKQKPGKPLYFGKKGSIPVFGLPGNPSSVLTCFYEYVLPCIEKMMRKKPFLRTASVTIGNDYSKKPGLTHFLKGYCDSNTAIPLVGQESYRMKSYAQANCLIVLDETMESCKKGEQVEIHWTDYFAAT